MNRRPVFFFVSVSLFFIVSGFFVTCTAQNPSPPKPSLTLFPETNYQGSPNHLSKSMSDLHGMKVKSVKLDYGMWTLCDKRHYKGRCVSVGGSTPDIAEPGYNLNVVSVKVVGPPPKHHP
jgi:hypothetical protein